MCVAEVQTRVLNALISSTCTEVFAFSEKFVHLQYQNCSSPAQNAFLASDKSFHLQCNVKFGGEEKLLKNEPKVGGKVSVKLHFM